MSIYTKIWFLQIWAATWQNQQNGMCAQQRLSSAWTTAQSDQSLRWPHQESLCPNLPIEPTAKTLIRLGRCPGWSESMLGTQSFCWFCCAAAHSSDWLKFSAAQNENLPNSSDIFRIDCGEKLRHNPESEAALVDVSISPSNLALFLLANNPGIDWTLLIQ